MLRITIFSVLLICFVSCDPKPEEVDSEVVEVTYVRLDTAVIEQHSYLLGDSTKHGTWKYYYRNKPKRTLKEVIEYRYDKIQGWNLHYREDGSLEYKVFFKNDIKNGSTIWYYPSGQVEEDCIFRKNKKYGPANYYYPNGKLRGFNIFDFDERSMYAIFCDSLGVKTSEEGIVISPSYVVVYENDSTETPIYDKIIKSGKPFLVKLTVAQTPETKTVVAMQDLTENQLVPTAVFENYTITYKQTLTKPGIHSYKVKGEMYGLEHNNLLRQDSVVVNIEVVNK